MKFLSNLFCKWWSYVKSYRAPYNPTPVAPMVQEDIRSKEQVRRFIKSFEEQRQALNIKALKPHECQDPISCEKDKCFNWEPDKIIRTMRIRPLRRKK